MSLLLLSNLFLSCSWDFLVEAEHLHHLQHLPLSDTWQKYNVVVTVTITPLRDLNQQRQQWVRHLSHLPTSPLKICTRYFWIRHCSFRLACDLTNTLGCNQQSCACAYVILRNYRTYSALVFWMDRYTSCLHISLLVVLWTVLRKDRKGIHNWLNTDCSWGYLTNVRFQILTPSTTYWEVSFIHHIDRSD